MSEKELTELTRREIDERVAALRRQTSQSISELYDVGDDEITEVTIGVRNPKKAAMLIGKIVAVLSALGALLAALRELLL